MSIKKSSSSTTLSSYFLILCLNDFFGSSLRELGISFHSLAPIFEKVVLKNCIIKMQGQVPGKFTGSEND